MELNNFVLFQAEVWGTVSDWIMIIVTGMTGYLIWQTLRSQMKVQVLQEKLLKIEYSKYRSAIMPQFRVVLRGYFSERHQLHVDLICEKSYTRVIKFFIPKSNTRIEETLLLKDASVPPNTGHVLIIRVNEDDISKSIPLKLIFSDEDDNQYVQKFYIYKREDEIAVNQGQPLAIDKLDTDLKRIHLED